MDDSRPSQDELQRAMRFASSPEAQQLKNLLQQSNAQGLKTAMEQAARGTYPLPRRPLSGIWPPMKHRSCSDSCGTTHE